MRSRVSPKVTAAALAGSITVILVWGASLAGLEIPPEVASAFTTCLAAAAGYLKSA